MFSPVCQIFWHTLTEFTQSCTGRQELGGTSRLRVCSAIPSFLEVARFGPLRVTNYEVRGPLASVCGNVSSQLMCHRGQALNYLMTNELDE
jgi:hypothetical protein